MNSLVCRKYEEMVPKEVLKLAGGSRSYAVSFCAWRRDWAHVKKSIISISLLATTPTYTHTLTHTHTHTHTHSHTHSHSHFTRKRSAGVDSKELYVSMVLEHVMLLGNKRCV